MIHPLPDKNDEAFETFRQYWNSCEEMKLAPEYGRIFAIFKSAARSATKRMKVYNCCAKHMGLPWKMEFTGSPAPMEQVCPHCEAMASTDGKGD